MKKIFILSGLCILMIACKQNKSANKSADIQYKGDTLIVSEQSVVNSKIKIYTVEESNYSTGFNTTGNVKAISGQMAEIAPPFDGRITKSFIKLGQKVNAGTPIFEIHSSEFSGAVKDYFQTLQTKKTAESNLSRRKDLVSNGVGSARELEEAETEYEIALREHENAEATLRMFGIDPESISMGQPMKVVSPIAGEIVQTNIVIGHYVKSDAEPLAIVADLNEVWVVAHIKEKDINSIRPEDKVEIRTEADKGHVITGRISHISELMDEETRSLQVLITCNNTDRLLKPGMFANVHFINAPKSSIVIPSTALLQKEDENYVFVQIGEGKYIRREVKATIVSPHESIINDGLFPGNIIISEGGIYLMAN